MNARAVAVAALTEWRSGRGFADGIVQRALMRSDLAPQDRAFALELFYGVLRNLSLLDFWIERLRSGRLDEEARDLLRVGVYQLMILRTPGHAAVFETVAIAPKRKRPLVNGVLRSCLRQHAELAAAALSAASAVRFSHPIFLVDRWSTTLGEEATAALCQWNNQPAPIYARVQQQNTTAAEFVAAHSGSVVVAAFPRFVQMPELPIAALARGDCYIQDPSTSVACELLDAQPGEAVLDACAAPGGKSALLADLMQNRGRLVACDREPERVARLAENLRRLRVTIASTRQHDWRNGALPEDSEETQFDRILIDVPCTNTGVMRRRVDVRWRLRSNDFHRMANEQLQIVRAVLPHLKRGGTLVYSTCSLEPEENERVVEQVCRQFPALKLTAQQAVLPFRDGFDGAFAAKFIRES
jgi:16S rRNA (cytosine967-C5)-methyltransferase